MVKSYMKLDGNLTPISVGTVGAVPKEEQTKTVTDPNFASGNVVVTPDSGKVLTQVTVVKDNDLVPEKIIKDVNIFGVVGTAEPVKEEQTKTVSSPNFASGNVVVTPDAGKVLTQVTVVKDADLVPENIVKDVNIFGVVGTAETGGGALPKLDTPVITFSNQYGIDWSPVPNAEMYKVYYADGTPTKASPFVPTRLLSILAGGDYENDQYGILNKKTVAVSAVAEGFLESDLTQSYYIYTCFIKGTAITLADRTTKKIEDITYDDNLLVWDFDNATFTSAKPIWIMREQQSKSYTRLTFDDNTELNLVGSTGRVHRVYDYDDKQFQYGNYIPLNNRTFKDNKETPKLISVDEIKEPVSYYNIITTYHMNLFANGVLTSCGYNNMYPIEDMAFVKDDRELVTKETYGNIKDKWYDGLRLGEQDLTKRSVNKAHEYISRLEALDVNRH